MSIDYDAKLFYGFILSGDEQNDDELHEFLTKLTGQEIDKEEYNYDDILSEMDIHYCNINDFELAIFAKDSYHQVEEDDDSYKKIDLNTGPFLEIDNMAKLVNKKADWF